MWYTLVLFELICYFGFLMVSTYGSSLNNIKISRPPKDYFSKSGNLQLICEAEGDPLPSITWYNARAMAVVDDETTIGLKVYKDIGLLMIQNPVERVVYEFYCNASNAFNWVMSRTVKTGRAFLSSVFELEPVSIQVVKPSQTVMYFCHPPIGNPYPKVHWLKDKRLILGKTFSKDKNRILFVKSDKGRNNNELLTLKIIRSKITDSGRYQCVATNDYGRVESSGSWLIVSDTLETFLNVKIDNVFAVLHQEITLLCDSYYKDNVRWISSKDIFHNARINISSNILFIKEMSALDNGIYACETNATNPKLLKIFRLNIGSAEVIDEKTTSHKKVVIEGVNVVLECDVKSSQTEFYWETPLSQPIFPQGFSHNRIYVSNNGNLNIKNVQASDSGKYTCNGHSSLDVSHKSIWLEVSKHQLELYPVISVPCQNLTVLKTTIINLSCEVIGEEIIKILWYKGLNIKQRLVNSLKISFPTKDSLTIIDSDINEDTNFYTCEAINDQGRKATWTSFVKVVDVYDYVTNNKKYTDLPMPPVVESPRNIKSYTLELTWSSVKSNAIETMYWIEYVYFGTNVGWTIYVKDWKSTHILIENLKPDTWYQFLVRTKDETGIGRASVPTEYVKTMNEDKHHGNIDFSFSKIKLHIPVINNEHDIRLTWSLNQISSYEKSSIPAQFYLLYKSISILQCIALMGNELGRQYDYTIPFLDNYCSLKSLTSENLKYLEEFYSPNNTSNLKLPINFNKTNLTKSQNVNLETFSRISYKLQDFSAFHCYNISIIFDNGIRLINSNNRIMLTPETKPSKPPEDVRISWILPEISITISWKIPQRQYWNGILTGSNIYMKSNESEIVLKYNNSQSYRLIKRVNSDLDWTFQISIINCAGESDKSHPIILKKLTSSFGVLRITGGIFKKSWMIATVATSSLMVLVMFGFVISYLCCIRTHSFNNKHINLINNQENETTKNLLNKDNNIVKIANNFENNKIMNDFNEDKSSSNNCASSAISSGQSSSPSNVSFCNPYASTRIFDGIHENKPTENNLFYLSTPIFEPLPPNKSAPVPLNYYLSNVPDWVANPILTSSFQQNHRVFPFHFPEDFKTSSNNDLTRTPKDKANLRDIQIEDSNNENQKETINNLLISTAPFSDQFSSSSKGKSTPTSSNSDSTHHLHHGDVLSKFGPANSHLMSSRRRQDIAECDQSTEMTHLLNDNNDRNSPSIVRVYDTPYSESSIDNRKNNQSQE